MAKNLKLSIIIPCLNEKRTIKRVVQDAILNGNKFFRGDFEIIVADNGSTDGSVEIVKKIKKVTLINVPVRGYGAALHWGIMKSKGKYALFGDADLSYPFSNLKRFAKEINSNADLILGSRIKGKIKKGAMPFLHRYLGTPVLTFLIRVLYKIPTTDCNSGMRLIKRSFYKKLNMRNSGMEWASEVLLKSSLKKGIYKEVPINFYKDKRGKKPHLDTWADGWRHLKAIFLLKPATIYPFVLVFLVLGVILFRISFGLSFLLFNLSVILSLCLLALHFLSATIENQPTKVSLFLKDFKLIPITGVISIIVGVMIIFVPDTRLGTKLFLVSILGIIFMWIFLIETIKTHLSNRLPDIK